MVSDFDKRNMARSRERCAAMAEAARRRARRERTCRNVGGEGRGFKCSECGSHTETWFTTPHGDKWTEAPRHCPNCGARVVAG